jgi:16S rRNA (uracil1498-N3)-methyltransferase
MKIHRFISTFKEFADHASITDQETVFQVVNVLKLKPGEEIILSDGSGTDTRARLILVEKRHLEIEVLERTYTKTSLCELHAYIAILKKDNLELAVQKITELGVTHITPIVSDRTIKKNYNQERLEKIIKEAVEQSGQSRLPRLHSERTLIEALNEAKKNYDVVICFDEPSAEGKIELQNKSIAFFIGPEGGWTPKEIELFKQNNVQCISLGNTTLRGETAAIVGTFYLHKLQK